MLFDASKTKSMCVLLSIDSGSDDWPKDEAQESHAQTKAKRIRKGDANLLTLIFSVAVL